MWVTWRRNAGSFINTHDTLNQSVFWKSIRSVSLPMITFSAVSHSNSNLKENLMENSEYFSIVYAFDSA